MKKKYFSFAGIYTFNYAAAGILLPLLGQYLAGIGFSGVQIGMVTAASTAVGIGASPFWGYRYHHSRDRYLAIIMLCFASALIITGASFVKVFAMFFLAYVVFTFFQTSLNPLVDAMTLENKIPFGSVRKYGSIGFAAGVFFAAQLAQATNLVIIFPLCAMSYIVACILIAYLRRTNRKEDHDFYRSSAVSKPADAHRCIKEQSEEHKKQHGNYVILIRNKKLMALLVAIFFICGPTIAHNTYFGFLYRDSGGSIAGVGIAILLMCSGEAPFMAWTQKLEMIFPMEKLILAAMFVSALRYLWYFTGPSNELLISTFFLQGFVNGIVLVEFVHYVAKLSEPAMIGMAMTLYQALSTGLSTIVCQMISGAVLDHFGAMHVYLFFTIYNAIGILLYISFKLYKCSD